MLFTQRVSSGDVRLLRKKNGMFIMKCKLRRIVEEVAMGYFK